MSRPVDQFRPTRWSLVQRAAEDDPHVSRHAWQELCREYQPAIESTAYRMARRYGLDDAWADDAVQDILLKLPRIARGATAKRGRINGSNGHARDGGDSHVPSPGSPGFTFRAYVSLTIGNALRDALRSRSRHVPFDPALDGADDETDPTCTVDEVEWARCVVQQALTATKTACEREGMQMHWGVFEARIIGPIMHGRPQSSYDELVRQYGLTDTVKAHSALQTAKRKYMAHLREIVARTCETEAQIDDEIRALAAVLASPQARSQPQTRLVKEANPNQHGGLP